MIKYFVLILLLSGSVVANVATSQAKEEKSKAAAPLTITLSKEPGKAAETNFGASDAMIYINFQGETLTKGDKLRMVFTLVDGGKTIMPNVKISESTLVADGPKAHGNFFVTKPGTGWTPGKYRVDVYDNATLAQTIKFTIK